MVLEDVAIIQGSQLMFLAYISLEISQIKRAMRKSDAIEYEKPAILTEIIPLKI
jgi:hypothetical protein